MNDSELLERAKAAGFVDAALIDTRELRFDGSFRRYCADNYCGNYGIHHACPPDCGAFEMLRDAMTARKRALVLRTYWDITDYTDAAAIARAKRTHNSVARTLNGYLGNMCYAGASPCTLCAECARKRGEACPFPDEKWSCLSAYCVDVKALAERCGMVYFAPEGGISLFSVHTFDGYDA